MNFSALPAIDVATLAAYLSDRTTGDRQFIDVREPQEIAIASLDGFENLPLSQYDAWASQIRDRFDADKETCVLCHHGVRSAQMCQWLLHQGFTNVKNITGGIDAYSAYVDPSVPRY